MDLGEQSFHARHRNEPSDTSYIDACSGIVNRGCYNPPCGGNAMDGGTQRAANFAKVLKAMKLI